MNNDHHYHDNHENTTSGNEIVENVDHDETTTVHQKPECDYGGYGYYYDDDYDYSGSGYYHDNNCSYIGSLYGHLDTIFLYEGFDFERPIYTFIWIILVIFTTLFNIVVIIVLLRKKMRNVIHMVLVAIAISDSMTRLVTLPTYIYTYSHYEPGGKNSRATYVLDKHWCNAFWLSKFFLSKWFHTVSIWLTIFLCTQRFVSVFPQKTFHNAEHFNFCSGDFRVVTGASYISRGTPEGL